MENPIVENTLEQLNEVAPATLEAKYNFLKSQLDAMGISLIQNSILVELLLKKMILHKMVTEEEFAAFVRSAYEELMKGPQEDLAESE